MPKKSLACDPATMDFILSHGLAPVTGCSEPAACGLAVALTRATFDNALPAWLQKRGTMKICATWKPNRIVLEVDRNTYKNGYDVAVPGTNGQKGLALAAALGFFSSVQKGLNLFHRLSSKTLDQAQQWMQENRVSVHIGKSQKKHSAQLSILAMLHFENTASTISCQIRGEHTHVEWIRVGKTTVFSRKERKKHRSSSTPSLIQCTLANLLETLPHLSSASRRLISRTIRMNREASDIGIRKRFGLGVGYELTKLLAENGKIDWMTDVAARTAAATDVRMSGAPVPVMASSGSGNQGLMATIPLLVAHDRWRRSNKRLVEAVALAHLWTAYASHHIGPLSPICGCVIKAGLGAAAGIAYYLDGSLQSVEGAIANMAGNVTGEICDGAKTGCAMKLATAASAALQSALLACRGIVITAPSGIVGTSAKDTMAHIANLAKSMGRVDSQIMRILVRKKLLSFSS